VILVCAAALTVLVLAALLFVRESDLHKPAPVSPFQHLDERKASIYENLRDLQFEYRVGKLSDADYQQTKLDLQKELAQVMAQVDQLKAELKLTPQVATAAPVNAIEPRTSASICATCGATFAQSLKFCGECGAPMSAMPRGQQA
jgi:NADH pyrophosphatase NudC (nudix superfamily)